MSEQSKIREVMQTLTLVNVGGSRDVFQKQQNRDQVVSLEENNKPERVRVGHTFSVAAKFIFSSREAVQMFMVESIRSYVE